MNKHILFVSIIILISISAKAQQGQWTWMNGSSTNNAPVWGTQGVFDSANTPIGLYEACQWTDSHGKFWLYGGLFHWVCVDPQSSGPVGAVYPR